MIKIHKISPLLLQTLIWPITRLMLFIFTSFEVRGLENLDSLRKIKKTDRERGIIFASNHSSQLDPIILPAGLPFLSPFMPIYYASREKEFYNDSGLLRFFYGGWFFRLWGAYPVYAGLKNYCRSLANQASILSKGKSLMIFPEGGINHSGTGISDKVKGGIGYLAMDKKCPIVPIGISGAYQMKLADFFLRRRKIILSIGTPIILEDQRRSTVLDKKFTGHTNKDDQQEGPEVLRVYKSIATEVMQKVSQLL